MQDFVYLQKSRRIAIGAHKGGGVAVTESLGSEELAVARFAVDFLVGAITSKHGV